MPEITPESYLDDQGEVSLSHEEREANTHHRAAKNYARRGSNTYEPGQDDLALHGVLAKLGRETNPLIREQLEAQAQLLASGATITEQKRGRRQSMKPIQTSDPTELNGSQSVMATTYGRLQAQVGRQELDDVLQYCRDNLDPEAAELLNGDLTSDDFATAKKAFRVAAHMKQNRLRNFRNN